MKLESDPSKPMSRRIVWLAIALAASVHAPAIAHPGGTASDGCHYCRTNCARWGEEQDKRHSHNGQPCDGRGGSGSSGSSGKPKDTTPPVKPKIHSVRYQKGKVLVRFTGEAKSQINLLVDGKLAKSGKANGKKQVIGGAIKQGKRRLVLVSKDKAGNKSQASKYVRADWIAPKPPKLAVSFEGDQTLIGITGEVSNLFLQVWGPQKKTVKKKLTSSGLSLSLTLPEGDYVVVATLKDAAGNKSKKARQEFSVTAPETGEPEPEPSPSE